jgi:hypothetical protein
MLAAPDGYICQGECGGEVGAVVSDDATAETDVTIVKDSALTWGNAKDRVVELDADTAVFYPFTWADSTPPFSER